MPPCGMGLVRISRMRLPPSNCSWNVSCATASFMQPVGDELVDVAGAEVAALGAGAQDAGRAARRPGRARAAGSSSSRNCRFQQISRMSLSNTLEPVPHLVERGLQQVAVVLQRLGGIVEQRSADWLPASRRRSSSDSTSRDEAAPMALASRCSVKRSSWMSASASGADRRVAACGILGERALGALGAEIAGHRVLQVAGRDGRAPQPERRRDIGGRGRSSSTNTCACRRSIGSGAFSSDTATNTSMLAAMLHSTPCVSGSSCR